MRALKLLAGVAAAIVMAGPASAGTFVQGFSVSDQSRQVAVLLWNSEDWGTLRSVEVMASASAGAIFRSSAPIAAGTVAIYTLTGRASFLQDPSPQFAEFTFSEERSLPYAFGQTLFSQASRTTTATSGLSAFETTSDTPVGAPILGSSFLRVSARLADGTPISGISSNNPRELGPSAFSLGVRITYTFDGDFNTAGLPTNGSARVAAAVPEPASWAMMIGGFALAGGALRRRHAGHSPVVASV